MDMKTMMQEHGEKFALAGTLLILVVYVVFGWVVAAPSKVYTKINEMKDNAKQIIARENKPTLPPLLTEQEVRAQWKVDDSLGNAQKGLEWVAYWRPKVIPELKEGPPVDVISLYPPKIDEPTVDIGKVNLSWSLHPDTSKDLVKQWVLFRKTGDAGAWEELTKVDVETTSYIDDKTLPKTTYSYKVKAIPDPVQKVTNMRGDESSVVSISTPDTTSIRFVGGTEQMAQIEVQKYINGNWEVLKVNVRPGLGPGSKIGRKETRTINRKLVTLDFETGYELLSITKEPRVTKEKKTRSVWKDDPNQPGKKIQVEEEYEETKTVTTLKIKYKDDAGAEKELWMEPPREKERPKK